MAASSTLNRNTDTAVSGSKPKKAAPSKKGKGRSVKAAPIVILVIVIGALVAVLGFNAFNIRNKYLAPILEKIPIVRNLLPAEEADEELSAEQLQAKVNSLTRQLAQSQQSEQSLTEANAALKAENTRLKAYEAQQEQFKADKADFDAMIAMNDPRAYADFYAGVYPDTAEELYRQAVGINLADAEDKAYVKKVADMDGAAAAKMLEELIPSDIDLVVRIMRGLKSENAAEILNEMTTPNAAVVTKMMAPAARETTPTSTSSAPPSTAPPAAQDAQEPPTMAP